MINDQPESQIKKKKTKYEIKTKLFMSCLFYHSQYVYQNWMHNFILVMGFLQQQKLPLLPYKRDSKCVDTTPTPPPPNLASFTRLKFLKNRIKRLNLFIHVDLFLSLYRRLFKIRPFCKFEFITMFPQKIIQSIFFSKFTLMNI